MIPVPGSSSNLHQAAADAVLLHHHQQQGGCLSPGMASKAAPISVPSKRSSKTGSSSISSQEHASLAPSGQEAASAGAANNTNSNGNSLTALGRKLAPIKTSVAPRGPRLRLGGRLLSPEEAQKHLQAVAAAAAAATSSGRSLSRAQSPAVTCPGGRSSPAGPNSSSTSISAGHSSGVSAQQPCGKPPVAAAAAAPNMLLALSTSRQPAGAGTAATAGMLPGLLAYESLPDNFIPTPEGADTWNALASTLDEDFSGATSRGGGSSPPLVQRCSYTELLMGDANDASGAAAAAAASAGGAPFEAAGSSAFAATSGEPWPQQQQGATAVLVPVQLTPARSFTAPVGCGVQLSSSVPVHIPVPSAWPGSALLSNSISGSNGSCGTNTLAASLNGDGSAPGHPASLAGAASVGPDAELSQLLDCWGPEHMVPQRGAQQHQPQQAVVSFVAPGPDAAGLGAAPRAPAWKPAFAPAFTPAGASMVPTPGLPAAGNVPVFTDACQQQQQSNSQAMRSKTSASKGKRHSKQPSTTHKQQQQQAEPQVPQPVLLAVADGQQVVLSQQELMAVLQQNMAASFASGYLMAQQQQQPQGEAQAQQQQQPQQPQLLKPVATLGPFIMPAAATPSPPAAGTAPALPMAVPAVPAATAAAPAALAAGAAAGATTSNTGRQVRGNAVDDILPSLQELLTDCY